MRECTTGWEKGKEGGEVVLGSGTIRGLGAAAIVALGVAACGGASTSSLPGAVSAQASAPPGQGGGGGPLIKHVVIVIQENRSFDDLFATFPGADGATQGLMKGASGSDTYVPLKEVNLLEPCDFGHGYAGFLRSLDDGKMDGFAIASDKCHGDVTAAYQYVNPSQITPYWTMAKEYVLADHMFQTQGSGSFTAHQDLIAGGTMINPAMTKSLVDYPSALPWGCDAAPGTKTNLLIWTGTIIKYRHGAGPFPCLGYETLRDLLDAKSISWKYYSTSVQGNTGALWNAFEAIKAVRYGPEWGTKVTSTDTQIFTDISNHKLPAVSWIIPDGESSDHPGGKSNEDLGPSWVASIVNAVGESSYWQHTAIIILWDDWGGFYDNVPPPLTDHWGGLGFRVPMIVVSPYAPRGGPSGSYVSHTPYEFGSILKFIENNFGLGSLGKTDARATSMVDCFDFTQAPRPFQEIPSTYSRWFFMHKPPSNDPPDTE
jgi:phospholipase C